MAEVEQHTLPGGCFSRIDGKAAREFVDILNELTATQMIKNNNDISSAVFAASEFLADVLARYSIVEAHYLDMPFNDSRRLEEVVIQVYSAVLNYTAAVTEEKRASSISEHFLEVLKLSPN